MKNQSITLSLPKELLMKVKLVAVQRRASVSGLLAESVERLVEHEDRYAQARRRHLDWLRHGIDLGTGGQVTAKRYALHGEARIPQFVDTNILIYAHDVSSGPKI